MNNSKETEMKKFSLIPTPVLMGTLLLGTLAFAHGGMEHVLGTVTAVTDHSLSVKTRDGAVQIVEFDSETKFVKGDAAASVKDVQVGSRVAIHAHKTDNTLHAAEVKIGADAAASQR
jgi:Domain of unknown function (DUF5666)